MAYVKQNFKNGDVLKAEQLNNIENGIINLEDQKVTLTATLENGSTKTYMLYGYEVTSNES